MATLERFRECLSYDEHTGIFVWVKRTSNRVHVGNVANRRNGSGYILISLDGDRRYAHRLAWEWCYGSPVPLTIDHINGNRSDNRIANLRSATNGQQMQNSATRKHNRSGRKGAELLPHGRYSARIRKNGQRFYLGSFDTAEQAHEVYAEAAKNLFGEFACVDR